MGSALKILIVDDDKTAAAALGEVVKRLGFKPIITHRGQDALSLVRMQTVHGAVVDVLLPKITGVDLVAEFRRTKFGSNPVIFISGVFKDKSFINETLKKTSAVDFLLKPFSNEDITAALSRALESQTSSESVSVQSLLTRPLASDRERSKAIENMEQIKGLDFPFLVSILMEAGSSGHLNIVNDSGEIFGVTMVKGAITEFDGAESQSAGVQDLIARGFLKQDDWDEFQKNLTRKFSLDKLAQEGYVSPHAVNVARRDQIRQDFRTICMSPTMRVNFVVQDGAAELPRHAVRLPDLLQVLDSILSDYFTEEYLQEFYATVVNSPFKVACSPAQFDKLWAASPLSGLEPLKNVLKSSGTIAGLFSTVPDSNARIYQGLHYLVVARAVLFEDAKRAGKLNQMIDRYQKLYEELNGKTPDKVFEYFGATTTSSKAVISNLFEEYAKANNPDQLGKDATPELRELCRKCYDIVNSARDTLTDEGKKMMFMQKMKEEAAEKQVQSQKLMAEGWEILRHGKASDALVVLQEAAKLVPNNRLTFLTIWAEMKAGGTVNKVRLSEMYSVLDAIPIDERKAATYHMALGLIKKAMGDTTAAASFEKAMQLDPQFVEARRELNAKNDTGPNTEKNKKLDFFNDDITTVVSQIFRRKVD